ncbi:MAG TPA: hypothetical protein VFL04_05740 [Rectinemataceae bacterium]|nr:hypothetical protein [Rectinemataceae bacterium]
MRPQAMGLVALACLALAATMSCQASSGLLSDSERKSLYTISITANGSAVADGSVLDAASALQVAVTKASEAEEPQSLELSLENPEPSSRITARMDVAPLAAGPPPQGAVPAEGGGQAGTAEPAASAAPADGSEPTAAAGTAQSGEPPSAPASSEAAAPAKAQGSAPEPLLHVGRITGTMPPVSIGTKLASGAYRLSASIFGADRALLQRSSFVVFVGTANPAIGSVSVYPPVAEPGEALLLQIELELPTPAGGARAPDPWIRWTREGRAFAEGPLSKGFDRVVWTAPWVDGAYALLVEAFPSAPPDGEGFGFRSRVRQEFKAMVKASGGGEDEFADATLFSSLLRFEGNLDDAGRRARSAPPSALGTPRLDVYPGGFGYRFGATAGVNLPGLMPPSSEGLMSDFSILFRLSADGGDGRLVRFASEDGGFALTLGLRQHRPFVEILADGKTSRSVADSAIPQDPMTLVASFARDGGKLRIVWHAEGVRVKSPSLNVPQVPQRGGASIGGPDSLEGVYDAFGVMQSGAPPAFRMASRRAWKTGLVLAEGFEDGRLPPGAQTTGGAAARAGRVELPAGSSIRFPQALDSSAQLHLEAEFSGEPRRAALLLEPAGTNQAFVVLGTGEVLDDSGKRLGALSSSGGSLAFEIGPSPDRTEVLLSQAGSTVRLPLRPGASLGLSVGRDEGSGPLALERIIVRGSSAPVPARP